MEDLARRADLSVDTIRFYQKRRLLPPPERSGRVAWYGPEHLERLARIRELQSRGLTLALIGRILDGDLDATDAPLAAAVARADAEAPEEFLTLAELAERSGVPVDLLEAVARENLLVARVHDGEARYTTADIAIVQQGLRSARTGPPAPRSARARARRTTRRRATIAETAVGLFDRYVRAPLRASDLPDDEKAERLVEAFRVLLPAVTTLVAHHFRRVLLEVAQEHLESVGEDDRARGGQRRGREPARELAHMSRRPRLRSRAPRPRRQAACRRRDVRPHRAALRRAESRAHVPHGCRLAPRRPCAALALPRRSRVLDLACGTGDLCRTLADAGSPARRRRLLRRACCAPRTPKPRSCGPTRCTCRSPTDTFDGLTCGFALRNFAALAPMLAECGRVLRPGGRVALLDVAEPESPLVRAVHGAWFRHVVPFVGGLVSDRAAYRYLPASTAYLPPLPELLGARRRRGHRRRQPAHARFRRRATHHGTRPRVTTVATSDAASPASRLAARSVAIDEPVRPARRLRARRLRLARRRTRLRHVRGRGASSRPPTRTRSWRRSATACDDDRLRRARVRVRSARCRSAGAGDLVVPARIVGRDDRRPDVAHGHRRRRRAGRPRDSTTGARAAVGVPRHLARPPANGGAAMVEQTLADIDAGRLEKVVLARAVHIDADRPFDVAAVLALPAPLAARLHRLRRPRFRRREPRAARPQGRARRSPSRPLAGTGIDTAALVRSAKDAHEHRLVVDAVVDALRGLCVRRARRRTVAARARRRESSRDDRSPPAPTTRTRRSPISSRALHPTPAVGGTPRPRRARRDRRRSSRCAARPLRGSVRLDRSPTATASSSSRYAAARSTVTHAVIHAGAGIVSGSDPGRRMDRDAAEAHADAASLGSAVIGVATAAVVELAGEHVARPEHDRRSRSTRARRSAAGSAGHLMPERADGVGRERRVLLAQQHQRRVERDGPAQQVRPAQREQRQRRERVPGHHPRARDEERREARGDRELGRSARRVPHRDDEQQRARDDRRAVRRQRAQAGRHSRRTLPIAFQIDCRLISPECSCAFCSQPDMKRYGSTPNDADDRRELHHLRRGSSAGSAHTHKHSRPPPAR